MKKYFNSIKSKVIILDLLFVFPLFILFCVSFWLLFRNNNLNLNYSRLAVLEENARKLSDNNMEIIKISNALYLDQSANRIASKKEKLTGYQYIRARQEIQEKMLKLTSMFPDRQYQLMLLCKNGNSYFQVSLEWDENVLKYDRIVQEDWYADTLSGGKAVYFLPKYRSDSLQQLFSEDMLFAVQNIRNLNSGREIGILIVAISQDIWKSSFGENIQSEQNTLAFDQYGKIIFASDQELYGMEREKNSYSEKINNYEKGFFLGNIKGVYSHIYFADIKDTNWKLVSYMPYKVAWSSNFLLILGIGMAAMTALALVVSYNCNFIARRMKRLNKNILAVKRGNLNARIEEQYENEFQELCVNFNSMLDYIEDLMKQLKEEEGEKRSLEIQALQAQINPHFLYNTIASIRFMIQMEQYEKADLAMVAFSKLLRKAFSDNRRFISVREEITVVEEYLKLMKIRYEDSFQWNVSIAPDAEELGILKNTIQPLVENSISHGFNEKTETGHIWIRIYRKTDCVCIEVEDDGVGADLQKINDIIKNRRKSKEQFSGLGLSSIQVRIVRNFGDKYGLTAQVNRSGGVTFLMKIPPIDLEGELY